MSTLAKSSPEIACHRSFVVSQNPRGKWVARETDGMIEGVFHSQRDALRFALYEAGDPRSVVVISGKVAEAGPTH